MQRKKWICKHFQIYGWSMVVFIYLSGRNTSGSPQTCLLWWNKWTGSIIRSPSWNSNFPATTDCVHFLGNLKQTMLQLLLLIIEWYTLVLQDTCEELHWRPCADKAHHELLKHRKHSVCCMWYIDKILLSTEQTHWIIFPVLVQVVTQLVLYSGVSG